MENHPELDPDIVVAGHICLDIILSFKERHDNFSTWLEPGKCVITRGAKVCTGGAVANTGLALHQLGIPTRLVGKLGADTFGEAILGILRKAEPSLTEGMIVDATEETSYTIVLSPPGIDRSFLHSPGANDHFRANDIRESHLRGARFFHFGYPPELHQMFINHGHESEKLMRLVKNRGLTTSMDMALPDPGSEAGNVDWGVWLSKVMPHVDICLPSLEEIYFMLDRQAYEQEKQKGGIQMNKELLEKLAGKLLDMGVAIVVIKLGENGLFMKTASDQVRLEALGAGKPRDLKQWLNVSHFVPAFQTKVAGTTGAGDCAVAGFLAGLSKDLPPGEVLTMATAAAAFSVEKTDASSGVPHWAVVQKRVHAGWSHLPQDL